jgi:hypothetical protein
MSAVPLIQTQPLARPQDRRYWLDEGSLQTLLDLMFSYVAGQRAFGSETYLGWTITWETRYESTIYSRGGAEGEEFLNQPAGYSATIRAPGLVSEVGVDRILSYLDQQGLSAVAYEQEATSFEFAIGA